MLKSKILALLLCCSIAASMLPVTARAEGSEPLRTVHVDSYSQPEQWLTDDEACTVILDADLERLFSQMEALRVAEGGEAVTFLCRDRIKG